MINSPYHKNQIFFINWKLIHTIYESEILIQRKTGLLPWILRLGSVTRIFYIIDSPDSTPSPVDFLKANTKKAKANCRSKKDQSPTVTSLGRQGWRISFHDRCTNINYVYQTSKVDWNSTYHTGAPPARPSQVRPL